MIQSATTEQSELGARTAEVIEQLSEALKEQHIRNEELEKELRRLKVRMAAAVPPLPIGNDSDVPAPGGGTSGYKDTGICKGCTDSKREISNLREMLDTNRRTSDELRDKLDKTRTALETAEETIESHEAQAKSYREAISNRDQQIANLNAWWEDDAEAGDEGDEGNEAQMRLITER